MDQIAMGNSSTMGANFYASFTMSDKTNIYIYVFISFNNLKSIYKI